MLNLTAQQIADAKNNDITAVTAVIAETEERVTQLARKYATTGGRTDVELAEDFAQIGRVAVWQALSTFEGSDVAQFFTYIDKTVSGTLSNERRAHTRQGVSQQAVKDFEHALTMAAGDPYAAQRIATDADHMGARKMSKDLAYAARLSWQGVSYLDAPVPGLEEDALTFGAMIPTIHGIPGEDVTAKDVETARQRETKKRVHATLSKLGAKREAVLKGTYGIAPAPMEFGTENEELLAEWVGIKKSLVRQTRSLAKGRFAEIYLAGESA